MSMPLRAAHRLAALVVALALLPGCSLRPAETAGPAAVQAPSTPAVEVVPLPNQPDSLKFAVLGDFGTGAPAQYQLASRWSRPTRRSRSSLSSRSATTSTGRERPQDFCRKSSRQPYKPLLDAKVKFYASLGNHDSARAALLQAVQHGRQALLLLQGAVRERPVLRAREHVHGAGAGRRGSKTNCKKSNEDWKIAYFHHPLYSSGERHGSDTRLRKVLEPLFVNYNVSVVFAGHDHFYERIKPQQGIVHFVVGSGGQLRRGNIDRPTKLTARGFDTDLVFLVAEISGRPDDVPGDFADRAGRRLRARSPAGVRRASETRPMRLSRRWQGTALTPYPIVRRFSRQTFASCPWYPSPDVR